jgi:hypothetical protein
MHLETLTWLIEAERRREAARLQLAHVAGARAAFPARTRAGLVRATRRAVGRSLVDLGTRIAAPRPPTETGTIPG